MLFPRALLHQKFFFFSLILTAFLLPLHPLFTSIAIVILFLNWLAEANFKEKFSRLFRDKPALLFISLYLWHVTGLIYSSNIDFGLFDLQVKLSLLLFPLILSSSGTLQRKQIEQVLFAFVYGNLLAVFICYSNALYLFFVKNESHFFYELFSVLMHPTYFSLYLAFSFFIILSFIYSSSKELSISKKVFFAFLLLLFSFTIFLLSARWVMMVFILLLLLSGLWWIIQSKKYFMGFSGILLFMLAVWLLSVQLPGTRERFRNFKKDIMQHEKTSESSAAVRIEVWKSAYQLIRQNLLFGTGTGDAKDELMKQYEKDGVTGALKRQLNAHNQYIQTWIATGFVGFLILLLSFGIPLWMSIEKKNRLYAFFLLLFFISVLTESCLEVQAGVVFYALFNAMLNSSFSSD